jgi:hypothetical membrane protein
LECFELSNNLRIAGIFGLIAPIFCFACILLAIASGSSFNWVNNALSDLGVQKGITPLIFNSGLVVSGFLFIIFATGLFPFIGKRSVGKVGVTVFILACGALISIGIFNENFSPAHYIFSVAFFMLFPISMLILVGAFWAESKRRLSVFTLALSLAAAFVWVLQFAVHYVSNVAVPEFVSGLLGAVWVIDLSYLMLKKSKIDSS